MSQTGSNNEPTPTAVPLLMYGQPSDLPSLEWERVDEQLRTAGTYWAVIASGQEVLPHPRPVWGVWSEHRLYLSIGSPTIRALAADGTPVAVHLDSGTDAVILNGTVNGTTSDADVVSSYNAKYDWAYDINEYGPFTIIDPTDILAWRAGGWAGRDGFTHTSRWVFRTTH